MGKIVREVKMASEPEALLAVLSNPAYRLKRIGLEAGPLSQWLYSAVAEAGLPVICVETRHMRAVLQAQINKTDRNDARGIAQMMRVGLYRPVHVKITAQVVVDGNGFRLQQLAMPNLTGEPLELHWPWNDVPRGTMDEVNSHVRLDLPSLDGKAARKIVPPRLRILWWKGLSAESEEKREPASYINPAVAHRSESA
jgi:Transposase